MNRRPLPFLLSLLLPLVALANDAATISPENSGGPQQSQTAPVPVAASSFIEINGTASTLVRIALPRDAVLRIRVEDRGRKGKTLTLSEQTYDLAGTALPAPFNATIDRDLLGKRSKLFVTARVLQKGKTLFVGEAAVTAGDPHPVNIVLRPASPKIAH